MSALTALKRSIRAAVLQQGELAGQDIYDHPPPSARFPYLSFGRASLFDWSTATEPGTEILLGLDVWSRAMSSAEAARIAGQVEAALAWCDVQEGYRLVNLAVVSCACSYDPGAAVHHAALTLRAVLEPQS